MDKIAFYEEAILDSVFEKEAGAMNRFMRNIRNVEIKTGLTAELPRLERALERGIKQRNLNSRYPSSYIQAFKDSALRDTKPNYDLDGRIRDAKIILNATPYRGNTGLANKGERAYALEEALKRNKKLQYAKKQQSIVDSLKAKSPNIKGVLFN